ncbi:MAG: glycosyltransferase family 2 protein, partial [Erysipelotrichia bacterium]|nr:glycosyltransferase family 2 protein [Erysipelotrichia bacterium]
MILSDYNQPLVTILLTTFNAENFLVEQIESILHQTYSNIELVIHDDASDDRTCSIIEDYCQKYSNIKLIKNNHNIGCVNNFESAISSCSAKYIALSDQDDIWARNKLEMQMQNLLRYEKGHKSMPIMVHSDLMMIDESNRVLYRSYFQFRKYKLKKHKDLGHILGPCGVMGNTILFNDALKKLIIPFPHNLSIHDYWIALITELLGKRITIYSPLVQYRIHSNNLSNNQSSLQRSKGLVSSLKAWKNQKKKIPYAYP